MPDVADEWVVHITNDDVRMAKAVWARAVDDSDSRRAALLYDDLRRVISAQAQQTADYFREAGRRGGGARS